MPIVCDCVDYEENMIKLNNAVRIAQDVSEFRYTGKLFRCCPWCGRTLHAPDAAIAFEPEVLAHLEAALNILRAQPTPRL